MTESRQQTHRAQKRPKRECPDIRPVRHVDRICQRAKAIIVNWPLAEHDRGTMTAGINCLIVLLHVVYVSLDSPFGDKSAMQELEAMNPFLAHAWLKLKPGFDSATALEKLATKVWGKPLEEVEAAGLTFQSLINSDVMRDTLWSMKACKQVSWVAWARRGESSWLFLDAGNPGSGPASVHQRFGHLIPAVKPESFRIAAYPGMDLGAEYRAKFGDFRLDDFTVSVWTDGSALICVTFDVKDVDETRSDGRLHFDSFRRLQAQGGIGYTLIALVKCGDKSGASDTIRIYDTTGEHRLPPKATPPYARPTWKMADMRNGDVFMAMYVQCPIGPNLSYPELRVPEVVDMKFQESFDSISDWIMPRHQ